MGIAVGLASLTVGKGVLILWLPSIGLTLF